MTKDRVVGTELGYCARTSREGVLVFTHSRTPQEALDKLKDALLDRRVLVDPRSVVDAVWYERDVMANEPPMVEEP